MAPDKNLALYTARHTSKKVFYWHGYCPIHHHLSPQDVRAQKKAHPEAPFLAHPECPPEVLDLADLVQSTSGMLRHVTESPHASFIIGTEMGILHPMRKQNPKKTFYPAADTLVCPSMKLTTLEDVLRSLDTLTPRVTVPEEVRLRAFLAVERMLAIR
jgi:quinolinate synthase